MKPSVSRKRSGRLYRGGRKWSPPHRRMAGGPLPVRRSRGRTADPRCRGQHGAVSWERAAYCRTPYVIFYRVASGTPPPPAPGAARM